MSEPLLMHFEQLPEQDRNRIMKAVDDLCKNNPHVVAELEKLADIKCNNPMQWKMGKKILKM